MYDYKGNWIGNPVIDYDKPIQDAKIPLIKWVRQHHGLHLRDAKDVVERFLMDVREHEVVDDEMFLREQREVAEALLCAQYPERARQALRARSRAALANARLGR